jgi:hypothetical protein
MNRIESSRLTFTLRWLLAALLFFLHALRCDLCLSQEHPYLGSTTVATHQRLQSPLDDQIDGAFGYAMDTLSRLYDLPMWVDRHIAKDDMVTVEPNKESLEFWLERMADRVDSQVIILDNLVLIAPNSIADSLSLAYWELKTSKIPREWNKVDNPGLSWSHGSTSIDVSNALCHFAKLDNGWTSNVDHDHWPEHSFSKVNRLAIATSVLGSLGKKLRIKDEKASVVPLVVQGAQLQPVPWKYTPSQMVQIGREHWIAWKTDNPTAVVQKQGESWLISASPKAHRSLVRPLIPTKKWIRPKSNLYSLKLQGSLEKMVPELAMQLKLDISPLPMPEKIGKRQVMIDVKDATIDVMLREIGNAGGIEFRKISTDRYEIHVMETP